MEDLSSLTFKGSVSEAIAEAKEKKKLLLVYISGEDGESDKLNKLTLSDASVIESISKHCVFLHARVDPTTFSPKFPYSNVPCLTAIGSSGVKVWNNDGFIEAVDLTSSLNMAWLELNILETTASILGENSDDEAVENGVVEAEKEDGEEEPEESKVGDELNLVFTTRFTQFFKWMEKPLPASSSFFERASNAFDASRRLIINKAAGQVVISQNVKNKKGAAARFAAIASLACLCTIPALFGYYKWIVASLKKEEKEELREVLKALDEKVSANTKDICVLQLEASKMREWKSEMEAFSSATTSDIRVLQLAVSKMSEWRSAMEASSSLLRRNTENSRIARQELDMAMHTLKFNKMMRGL